MKKKSKAQIMSNKILKHKIKENNNPKKVKKNKLNPLSHHVKYVNPLWYLGNHIKNKLNKNMKLNHKKKT